MSHCCGGFDVGKHFVENLNGQGWSAGNMSRLTSDVGCVVEQCSKPHSQPAPLLSLVLPSVGNDAVVIH